MAPFYGGGASPLLDLPHKGVSPLDPVKMPHILYLIQSKSAIKNSISLTER
ncbi:hypothetical protein MBAV_006393 [Candidatus Magnetobacterium bavaricum]|uniref:Uncharacterized protein n=1 Tax=Candidatus Magnetobacterium bavaricum TaxID=29290 RepID=A0A0F3GL58_9BACT|nr:hypothetical protein MBAV_006393 [Candidatus Magnetobacterium bavaricum]